jgi:hypothetical protein
VREICRVDLEVVAIIGILMPLFVLLILQDENIWDRLFHRPRIGAFQKLKRSAGATPRVGSANERWTVELISGGEYSFSKRTYTFASGKE